MELNGLSQVQVNLYAAAKAAAGSSQITYKVSSFPELILKLESLSQELKQLLPQCAYLLNGVSVSDFSTPLPEMSQVDVLPRFAGG